MRTSSATSLLAAAGLAAAALVLASVPARAQGELIEVTETAVDAAQRPLREAKRYVDGGSQAILDERRFLETAALIRANADRQAGHRGRAL